MSNAITFAGKQWRRKYIPTFGMKELSKPPVLVEQMQFNSDGTALTTCEEQLNTAFECTRDVVNPELYAIAVECAKQVDQISNRLEQPKSWTQAGRQAETYVNVDNDKAYLFVVFDWEVRLRDVPQQPTGVWNKLIKFVEHREVYQFKARSDFRIVCH